MHSTKDWRDALDLGAADAQQLRWLAESGYFCLYVGDLDAAATIFAGVQELSAEDPVGPLGLAETLLAAGDAEAALAATDCALAAPRSDPDKAGLAWLARARALEALGHEAERDAAEAAVLELAPATAAAQAVSQRRALRTHVGELLAKAQSRAGQIAAALAERIRP